METDPTCECPGVVIYDDKTGRHETRRDVTGTVIWPGCGRVALPEPTTACADCGREMLSLPGLQRCPDCSVPGLLQSLSLYQEPDE
jgi:hypothetical protein